MASTNPESDSFFMFGLSFIGSPSSELFLALSGTVLLPVKTGFRPFYKRRFTKLLPPLVIWSILGVLLYTQTHDMPWSDAWTTIARIPLQPTIGVYWFVYMIAGLYLFAPFISPWLHKATKRQIELFLAFWLVNMVFPWIVWLIPELFKHGSVEFIENGNYYWTLCYFGGFLGYWILGYYLKRYPIKIGLNLRWICLLIGTITYPAAIYLIKSAGGSCPIFGSVGSDNLQIGSAILVAFLYTIMQNIHLQPRLQQIVTNVSKFSFCIYLMHIYIRNLYWDLFDGTSIHIFPRTFLIAFLVLTTGYALTYILSFLPKSKYITGA